MSYGHGRNIRPGGTAWPAHNHRRDRRHVAPGERPTKNPDGIRGQHLTDAGRISC